MAFFHRGYLQWIRYWAPRIFVILFIVSFLLPAPDFIGSMGDDELTVFLCRLIWVVGVPLFACLLITLGALFRSDRDRPTTRQD
jgi:hypothetical protein